MLDALVERPIIEKNRDKIPHGGATIEVDEFLGENAGLVVAEVELQSDDQWCRRAHRPARRRCGSRARRRA